MRYAVDVAYLMRVTIMVDAATEEIAARRAENEVMTKFQRARSAKAVKVGEAFAREAVASP